MRLTLGILCLLMTGGAQSTPTRMQPLARVPEQQGRPLKVSLPFLDGDAAEAKITEVTSHAHRQVGIERIKDEDVPAGMALTVGHQQATVLSGKSVDDALRLLVMAIPLPRGNSVAGGLSPTFTPGSGVSHIAAAGHVHTFLDTTVEKFTVDSVTLDEAGRAVHHLFNSRYPVSKPGAHVFSAAMSGDSASNSDLARQIVDERDRRISVSLTRVTVRDILDAIVNAHGAASWVVRYGGSAGEYHGSDLEFVTFSQTAIPLPAQR